MSRRASYRCRQFVEDITAYLDNTLPDEVMARVEQHLAGCPNCREYLTQMRCAIAATGALGETDVERMPDELRDRLRRAFGDRT